MPTFGAVAVRDMFPVMEDIISQLVAKWERWISLKAIFHNHEAEGASDRFGSEHVINPTLDYTKLTFDAISLASMSHRMNSFYAVRSLLLVYSTVLTQTPGGRGAFRRRNEQMSHRMPPAIVSTASHNCDDD
jgi:hypothetical protein